MHLLLADENFSSEVSRFLRDYGHDVITLQTLGLAGIRYPDERVLAKATELDRAVITFNRRDFIDLHRKGIPYAGIIVFTFNRNSDRLAEKIHQTITEQGDLRGQLIRIYRDP